MQSDELIILDEFCSSHGLDIAFIPLLEEYGLVKIVVVDQTRYIPGSELPSFERLVRLHRELDINFEGIDAISSLLARIEALQHELSYLRNKLSFYEDQDRS